MYQVLRLMCPGSSPGKPVNRRGTVGENVYWSEQRVVLVT